MLIFLYGPDSYRRRQKLNRIIEEYQRKYSSISCDYFDFEIPEAISRFKEFSAQLLLFDNKKLAILENIFNINPKKLKEIIKPYLDSKDFTILISEENSAPAELKLLLDKAVIIEEFDILKGEKRRFFVQKEIKKRNLILTPKAISFLSEIFSGDNYGLINELEKISFLPKAANQNQQIDIKDLKEFGDYQYLSPNIFDFISALLKNWSLSKKMVVLEKLFLVQEEPVKIFNILASRNFLPKELIKRLADYDVMIKSGKMDYEEVLLDLVI